MYLLAFFALALALSVVTKESGHAMVYGLALFFALAYVLQLFGMILGGVAAGDPPQRPEMPAWTDADGRTHISGDIAVLKAYEEECDRYDAEMKTYQNKMQFVTDTVNLFSPMVNYYAVAWTVVDPSDLSPDDATSRIWRGIAALVAFTSVFFAAAYGKFMRMDVR
ncbi:ABC transporter permease subunit [Methanoculleus thermophilus]|nr:ABC transporter permease subunit [Methanoculleus thermophilus]HQD27598.1 ABC transporter permease subunit [Methanoculleus thermophilus]